MRVELAVHPKHVVVSDYLHDDRLYSRNCLERRCRSIDTMAFNHLAGSPRIWYMFKQYAMPTETRSSLGALPVADMELHGANASPRRTYTKLESDNLQCHHTPSYQAPQREIPGPPERESDASIPSTDQASHESVRTIISNRPYIIAGLPLPQALSNSFGHDSSTTSFKHMRDEVTYQKYCVFILPNLRHSIKVMIRLPIELRSAMLNPRIGRGVDWLDRHDVMLSHKTARFGLKAQLQFR
jgi:hypothetical protein